MAKPKSKRQREQEAWQRWEKRELRVWPANYRTVEAAYMAGLKAGRRIERSTRERG